MLIVYIVYELNDYPNNPNITFEITNVYLVEVK